MKKDPKINDFPSKPLILPRLSYASPGLARDKGRSLGVSPSLSSFSSKLNLPKKGSLLTKHVSLNTALKSRKPDLIRNLRRNMKNPYAYHPSSNDLPSGLLEKKYYSLAFKMCNY